MKHMNGVSSMAATSPSMTFPANRLLIVIALFLGLSLAGCGGGGGPPVSFYVDMARALAPAVDTVGADREDALGELRSRAEDGDAESRYRLGGLVYEQSRHEGWKWMCLAAAQGHGAAMSKLGYWSERDDTNPIRALAWYKHAALRGHLFASKYSERLARSMTSEQIVATGHVFAGVSPDGCDEKLKSWTSTLRSN